RSTSPLSALRASGRLRVMVAMRSLTSSRTTGSVMARWCHASRTGALSERRGPFVVGGQEGQLEVAETDQHRCDPPAEVAEVFVEQLARAVGEGVVGKLVEALVGDLDRVLRGKRRIVEVADLDRDARP